MHLFTDLVVYYKTVSVVGEMKKKPQWINLIFSLKQLVQWNTFRFMQLYIFAHGK